MKIIHIQNGMSPAGNAAYRLSCSMRSFGLDSEVLTLYKCSDHKYVHYHPEERGYILRKLVNRISNKLKLKDKIPNTYFYRVLPLIGRRLAQNNIIRNADVIYVHWVAGAISAADISSLIELGKPIIFFMHDMWSFTGGCHHSFNCIKYIDGCIGCPMFRRVSTTPTNEVKRLIRAYGNTKNMAFVSPSIWMAECAKKSLVLKNQRVLTIPNLLNEQIFKPANKQHSKKLLGLPLDRKIISFGCQAGTNNKFKGWEYLRDAINSLNRADIHIVIYGSCEDPQTRNQVKYPISFLGHIADESKLALICNATDVFVSPSLAESFGMTFMENILCNTPVVGFNNTAIPEIVKTGINGYLAENKNSTDLAKGIEYLLDFDIIPHDRDVYSQKNIIQKHLELIHELADRYVVRG